jgi:hypothetical protein
VANSSASTGVSWATPVGSLANPVINGGFDIWQRGTSITASTVYSADRWFKGASPGTPATISQQTTSDTTNLPFIQYCARVQRNSGGTGTGAVDFGQPFESSASIPFAGKTITLSFYARKGANYSAASSALNVRIFTGTGTDQNVFISYTGLATPIDSNVTLTTTWQRFSVTGTLASTITQLTPYFRHDPVGTAGAADYFEITGVQIDLGTYVAATAPAFRRSGGTLQGELAACQRYFNRIITGTADSLAVLQAISTTEAIGTLRYPVPMRTQPALSVSSAAHFTLRSASNSSLAGSTFNAFNFTARAADIYFTVSSGLVAGNATNVYSSNASATLDVSAEL